MLLSESRRHAVLSRRWGEWAKQIAARDERRSVFGLLRQQYPDSIHSSDVALWYNGRLDGVLSALSLVALFKLRVFDLTAMLHAAGLVVLASEIETAHGMRLRDDPAHIHPVLSSSSPAKKPVSSADSSSSSEDCIICWENKRDTVFAPCGHAGYCWKCASGAQVCPYCRAERVTPIKMFIP